MWYVAFTLGFFGSLHCVGMCGPLIYAFYSNGSTKNHLLFNIQYHLGKILAYASLGFVFGAIGGIFYVAGMQKILSLSLGVFLILMGIFSIDLDSKINSLGFFKKIRTRVFQLLDKAIKKSANINPTLLGYFNGLIPCGLVYIAIFAALAYGHVMYSALFMAIFGLGTMPALVLTTFGLSKANFKFRILVSKLYPILMIGLGVLMFYRGWIMQVPRELNFWDALNNPVMCH